MRQSEDSPLSGGWSPPSPLGGQPTGAVGAGAPPRTSAPSVTSDPTPRFRLGGRVRLKADQTRRGRIVGGPQRYDRGYQYEVTLGGDEGWYAEDDLESVAAADLPRWESRDELLRDVLLAKLRNPLTDSLYAYRASRTDYEPYQFRPILKFLSSPHQSLLIADEVGLGKTIEAAIIYLELKARLDISRVLVLCPSRLATKWQDELRNRFEEEFDILDSQRVRQLLDDHRRIGPTFPIRAIVAFELLRREEYIAQLGELGVSLDLLIVDEAHHLRNAEANTYRLGNTLVNVSDAVLFLTATPLNLRSTDLFNLLNLLAPDEFESAELFDRQVEPNAHINRAAKLVAAGDFCGARGELAQVERTALRDRFLRNPYYRDVLDRLGAADPTMSLADRVALQRELLGLNTLASVFTRTRKREVAHAAQRDPHAVQVTLTPAEYAFYAGVLDLAKREVRAAGVGAVGFAAAMKERQAASCLAALRETFEEAAKKRHAAVIAVERSAFEMLNPDGDVRAIGTAELLALSRQIGSVDSKFDRFAQTLDGALAADPTSKALVFSYFKRTLEYLRRRLTERGYDVEVIHGDVKIDERRRIIERFRADSERRILLSSEVGAEGLDFQFCDVLVNYDLPWNPMQVEQRIGRLDRFGQQHPKIRIYNFFIEDTVETRIFQRLYERIELFKHSIGDLEDILGDVITELTRKVLQAELTPEQEVRLANQAAERIIRRQQEEDALDERKDELLGQGQLLDQQVADTVTSGRVISQQEVRALVFRFLRTAYPRSRIEGDDEEPCWTVEFDVDLAGHLRAFVEGRRLHGRVSDELRRAMAEHKRIRLTFDDTYARQRPRLEFITVRHPLAEAARAYWEQHALAGIPASTLTVPGPAEEVGEGYFFLYVLDVHGVAQRVTLEPVVVLDGGRLAARAAEHLLVELQCDGPAADDLTYSDGAFSLAEQSAMRCVGARRDALATEMRRRNEALLAARESAIRTAFEAKIRRTSELLEQSADERIRRMRTAQVQNLQARMQAKLVDLRRGKDVSVAHRLVAGGRVRVVLGQVPRPEPAAASPVAAAAAAEPAALHTKRPLTARKPRPEPVPQPPSERLRSSGGPTVPPEPVTRPSHAPEPAPQAPTQPPPRRVQPASPPKQKGFWQRLRDWLG